VPGPEGLTPARAPEEARAGLLGPEDNRPSGRSCERPRTRRTLAGSPRRGRRRVTDIQASREMTEDADRHGREHPLPHDWLPQLIHRVSERMAEREMANPTPPPADPPEPYVDKPGTLIAAEKDLFRWTIAERLQRLLCGDVTRCQDGRCRRRRRCRKLAEMAPDLEAARATLAAEQAKWQPPSAPPVAPRRRRRR